MPHPVQVLTAVRKYALMHEEMQEAKEQLAMMPARGISAVEDQQLQQQQQQQQQQQLGDWWAGAAPETPPSAWGNGDASGNGKGFAPLTAVQLEKGLPLGKYVQIEKSVKL